MPGCRTGCRRGPRGGAGCRGRGLTAPPPATVVPGRLLPEARRILARFGPIVDGVPDDDDALRPLVAHAKALVARAPTRVTEALFDAAPHLRVVGRTGIGVDNVDLAAATARGIPVVVTPGTTDQAVAEGTLAILFALVKQLPILDGLVREGKFHERDTHQPGDLADATLAVVGFGRIGRKTAALARGVGMGILAVDPHVEPADIEAADAVPASLDEALGRADCLTLHVPLSEATRGLITASRLRKAGCRGLMVVNVARGAVAPLDELMVALNEGTVGGVGLDVFDPEPPDPRHPLLHRSEVVSTPHALALTPAAQRATFMCMAEGVATVLQGGRPPHVANPAALAA